MPTSVFSILYSASKIIRPYQSFLKSSQKTCNKLTTKFKFTGLQGSIIQDSPTFSPIIVPHFTYLSQSGLQATPPSCQSYSASGLASLIYVDLCSNVRGCSVYSALLPTYSTTLHIVPLYFSS